MALMPAPPAGRPPQRRRARCQSVETTTTRDSQCIVRVAVDWVSGEVVHGTARGTDTPQGRVSAGAAAAIEAIAGAVEGTVSVHVRGTKLVRAFDTLLVIVALRAQSRGRRYDLIGSTVAPEDDLARGAALAVLDATNRILEPHAQSPVPPEGPERVGDPSE